MRVADLLVRELNFRFFFSGIAVAVQPMVFSSLYIVIEMSLRLETYSSLERTNPST
jgi:hypothetical protein